MSIITFKQSNRELTEAIGSLFQREILAYLVSLKYYFKFSRSNLTFYKKHNPKLNINKFNNLFKFLDNCKNDLKKYKFVDVKEFKQIKKKRLIYNIPFHVSEKIISNISIQERTKLIKKFRKYFWTNNNKYLIKEKDYLKIVLHIRNRSKGDTIFGKATLPYQIFSYDYGLPNNNPIFYENWYFSIVKKILRENKSKKKVKILICSTGNKKDFLGLLNRLNKICKTELFLNFDEFNTFKKMILADHLILSQSSFSYLASLINNGNKYIRNGFRHPLSKDVKIIKDYDLLKMSYLYYKYCNILEKIVYLYLFIKNTNFKQVIKNRFKFF
jgi:hypothetical protein